MINFTEEFQKLKDQEEQINNQDSIAYNKRINIGKNRSELLSQWIVGSDILHGSKWWSTFYSDEVRLSLDSSDNFFKELHKIYNEYPNISFELSKCATFCLAQDDEVYICIMLDSSELKNDWEFISKFKLNIELGDLNLESEKLRLTVSNLERLITSIKETQ